MAWGGAMLSKYHAIFIPMGVARCCCCSTPRRRRRLLQPGPYLALAIGLAVFSPVLIWNARHGWVSFLFQGGARSGAGCPARIIWRSPCWPRRVTCSPGSGSRWSSCWYADGAVGRAHPDGPERLWLCVATVPLTAFTAVACFRPVLPHWGLIGLVPLFPMLGRAWAGRLEDAARGRPPPADRLCRPVPDLDRPDHPGVSGPAGSSAADRARWGILDARTDPTLDLYGWDQVAERIRQLGLVEDPRELRLHPILVPERPARLRPGRRPAGAVLQLRRSARIRVLEPSRGLDRPRRRPRPGRERARPSSPSTSPAMLHGGRARLRVLGRTQRQARPADPALSMQPATHRLSLRDRSRTPARPSRVARRQARVNDPLDACGRLCKNSRTPLGGFVRHVSSWNSPRLTAILTALASFVTFFGSNSPS